MHGVSVTLVIDFSKLLLFGHSCLPGQPGARQVPGGRCWGTTAFEALPAGDPNHNSSIPTLCPVRGLRTPEWLPLSVGAQSSAQPGVGPSQAGSPSAGRPALHTQCPRASVPSRARDASAEAHGAQGGPGCFSVGGTEQGQCMSTPASLPRWTPGWVLEVSPGASGGCPWSP